MLIEVNFSNGTPDYKEEIEVIGFSPTEIKIDIGSTKTKKQALYGYLKTIEYAFTGVLNRATGNINSIRLEKSWCGGVTKLQDNVVWDCRDKKGHTIIYDITKDSLNEKYFVADRVDYESGVIKPRWTNSLYSKDNERVKNNILYCILAFTKNIRNYTLKWDDKESKLVLLDRYDRVISIDDVKEDDVYILLKVINCLIFRDTHLGVFVVNCEGISDNVINALSDIIVPLYGDTFVFLYNCGVSCKVRRDVVYLPNYELKAKRI